jgi:hypothetical protein
MTQFQLSVIDLTKKNNGFFKSEAQAKFMLDVLNSQDGFVGRSSSAYGSAPIYAEYDAKGIIKLTIDLADGKKRIAFERSVEGTINDAQKKLIKSFERKLEIARGKVKEREDERETRTGPDRSKDQIELYLKSLQGYKDEVEYYIGAIDDLKKGKSVK